MAMRNMPCPELSGFMSSMVEAFMEASWVGVPYPCQVDAGEKLPIGGREIRGVEENLGMD